MLEYDKSGGVWVTYARYTFEDDAKKILINKNEIINNGTLEVYKTRWTQTGREFLLREWEKILRSVKGGENAENKRISRSTEEVG